MTFESVSSYIRNIGNLGDVILFVLERKSDKSVDAIFPLRRKKHFFYWKYFFLAPKMGFDYKPLWPSLNSETKNFFLEKIFAQIFAKNSVISLEPINQEFVAELESYIKSTQFKMTQSEFSEHLYTLSLPTTWQELLMSFSRWARKNIYRRQRDVVKSFTVSYENITNLKENRNAYEEFLNLHKTLIKEKVGVTPFEYKPFSDYVFGMVSGFGGNGGVFSMKLNGETASMILYADWGNTRFDLNVGILAKYKDFSVGRVLLVYAIEDAIKKGMKIFDFGQGDSPYKQGDWDCIKSFNKNVTIFSKNYVDSIDSLTNKIYNKVKSFMRLSFLQFPKKVWMNLSMRRR